MNNFELVLSLLNLLLGTGFIVTLVTLKQAKRKATTEVERGNVELVTASVNEMLQSVNSLLTQNKELVKEVLVRNDENAELKKKMGDSIPETRQNAEGDQGCSCGP